MMTFETQYMNRFWDEESHSFTLRDLAWKYLTITEDYDWTACKTARRGRFAIPVTPEERRSCILNAGRCMDEAMRILYSQGYTDVSRKDLLKKIHNLTPAFEAQYKPLRPDWETLPDYTD